MRLLLILDDLYIPSYGGGIKGARRLMEGLASAGHTTCVVSSALTRGDEGPRDAEQFVRAMQARGVAAANPAPHVHTYMSDRVEVHATSFPDTGGAGDYVGQVVGTFRPDWVIANEDKRRFALRSALAVAPDKLILLFQTIIQLPFGPMSVAADPAQEQLCERAQAVIVISRFLQRYVEEHSRLKPVVMQPPVYGDGPFPVLGRYDRGFVTMINPCELKGITILLALADARPEVSFAAVPTWGTTDRELRELHARNNINVLRRSEDIDEILSQTRVLLVPSLWPETFGYVVPEAMLRGIPVLASDVGGLPEATLAVGAPIRVAPARRFGKRFVASPQRIEPWSARLCELLDSRETYERVAQASRAAAVRFVEGVSVGNFEQLLERLPRESPA